MWNQISFSHDSWKLRDIQEVSAFSGKHGDEIDENDFWEIKNLDGSRYFYHGAEVQIMHWTTKRYLHSHLINFSTTSKDLQQEVTCYSDSNDPNTIWVIQIV
jgi:dolichyl-phosphate-mannose--protein O-mannosyl transferase